MKRYFVTGIGTGIGKTVVSAIVTEKLQADYWKPVQSGDLDTSDTSTVSKLLSNPKSRMLPEAFRLTQPVSPHAAAAHDGIEIKIRDIVLPETDNHLVIEGAGGLMVPLNDKELMIDLIKHLQAEVILVSMNYLGSINHTLLSVEALRTRGITIAGIVFNGERTETTETVILNFTSLPCIGRINWAEKPDRDFIKSSANEIHLPL